MDKSTVEQFQRENRPVWFMGRRTAMPIKARIVKICEDERSGEYAALDYICDDEYAVFKTDNVHFDCLYESKEDLIADICKEALKETAEIKAFIQTKDDCIRFLFSHNVSCSGRYTDWVARRAVQNIARKKWGLDLK